ncbi:dihydrofolate reductase [Nocardioides lijunqiniae]|uniref:dihydrofolate reductase n=1 Tax=Nocardioides lijunqiniae TaxID=2760832 RepID=UPI001D0C503D|nr:dihydrofolate reductase [Nocardioides lijunqiniae]
MSALLARSKRIVLIAAVAQNRVIGHAGGIPWRLPEDFAHFKRSTLHQTVLMGRATFDSIGRALPDRDTIVLTRDQSWKAPGVRVAHTLQAAVDMAEELSGDLMVAGGSHLYAGALPIAHMQVISEIKLRPTGDTLYPEWNQRGWVQSPREVHDGFDVVRWLRASEPSEHLVEEHLFSVREPDLWWDRDWSLRLTEALERLRSESRGTRDAMNWGLIYETAMQAIIDAANSNPHHGRRSGIRQRVTVKERLSTQELETVHKTLFNWPETAHSPTWTG